MSALYPILLGGVAAGIMWGSWPIVLFGGIACLFVRRSYVILTLGVMLDLVLMISGEVVVVAFFYTLSFFVATMSIEFVRERLLWW